MAAVIQHLEYHAKMQNVALFSSDFCSLFASIKIFFVITYQFHSTDWSFCFQTLRCLSDLSDYAGQCV